MKEVAWNYDEQESGNGLSAGPRASVIIRRINILDIVSNYVVLKQQRNGWWTGLCPFHDERNPSFGVNPESGWYKCFACQEKGNAIDFLRKKEHLDFRQALARAREMSGLTEVDDKGWLLRDLSDLNKSIEQRMHDDDSRIDGRRLEDIISEVSRVCGTTMKDNKDDEELIERVESVLKTFDALFAEGDTEGLYFLYDSFCESIKKGSNDDDGSAEDQEDD